MAPRDTPGIDRPAARSQRLVVIGAAMALLAVAALAVGCGAFERSPAVPSGQVAGCGAQGPPTEVRLTEIEVPRYLDGRFVGCAVWLQGEENGDGIVRVDPATNSVVARIVPGEVVTDLGQRGDELWALVRAALQGPNEFPRLVRIDAATSEVAETIQMPVDGMTFELVDGTAWIGGVRQDLQAVDLATGRVIASVPLQADTIAVSPGAVWIGGSDEAGASLARVDAATFEVTSIVEPAAFSDWAIVDDRIIFGTERGEIVRVSATTSAVLGSIRLVGWTQGFVGLAADGADVWVLPTHLVPNGNEFRLESRELLRVDGTTGQVVERIDLVAAQPLGLWVGGGSLWLARADQPLLRIELPAGGR